MKGFFIENIDDFADSTVSFLLLYRKSYQLVELGGSCKKESCLTFGTKTHPPTPVQIELQMHGWNR